MSFRLPLLSCNPHIVQYRPRLHTRLRTRTPTRYKLNVWDVGGQKTIRSYWRNYFEQTDGVIWVVDSADRRRIMDCKDELSLLLTQEVTRRAR